MAPWRSISRKGFRITIEPGLNACTVEVSPLMNTCGTHPVRSISSTAETPLAPSGGGHRAGLGCLDCANFVAHRSECVSKQHADQDLVLHHENAERFHRFSLPLHDFYSPPLRCARAVPASA